MSERDRAASPLGVRAEGADVGGTGARLTEQQRMVLDLAAGLSFVSARLMRGTLKPNRPLHGGRRAMTLGSGQAVMRRLAARGLLAQDDRNPAIFRITDAGREARA